jgi:hypothetical protein
LIIEAELSLLGGRERLSDSSGNERRRGTKRRGPGGHPVFILALRESDMRGKGREYSERQHPATEQIAGLHGHLQTMRIRGVYTIELDPIWLH